MILQTFQILQNMDLDMKMTQQTNAYNWDISKHLGERNSYKSKKNHKII